MRTRNLVALVLAATTLAAGASPAAAKDLVGTFKFTPGKSKHVGHGKNRKLKVSGTYFRMLLSGKSGKHRKDFFPNPQSRSKDHTYTLMRPGIDGGLSTSAFQPMPNPAFDEIGSSFANRIMKPERFAGIKFSLSTDSTDQQSGLTVGLPVVHQEGRKLSGDLRAFTASWNKEFYNQGSPKPDGIRHGGTRKVTGTYNPKTRAYTLNWKSQIVGGSFNGFVGFWHLTGKFVPAA